MNKLLAVAALSLSLLIPSCAAVQSARDKLEQMPQEDFESLVVKVGEAGQKAGEKLKELLADKPEIARDVDTLAAILAASIQNDALDTSDLIRYLIDRFGSKLESKYVDYLRDGAKIIDAAVGQIRLGIDGKFTSREKLLAVTFLFRVHTGLSQ